MTTTAHLEAVPTSVADIPLQAASQDIWEMKPTSVLPGHWLM
jgi:hypothetical protein